MGFLALLQKMKAGDSATICEVLPGVTKESMMLTLNQVKKGNYMVTLSFMGVKVKDAVFYDHKGELIEVTQCHHQK